MKKILILSLIGLLFASCKKDEKDYREDFVGTYSCAIDEHYQRADTGEDTHTMSVDTIEVGMVDDSMLYFKSIPRGSYYFGSDKGHIKVEAGFLVAVLVSLHSEPVQVRAAASVIQ